MQRGVCLTRCELNPWGFRVPNEVHRKKIEIPEISGPRSLPSHSLQMRTRSNFDSIMFAWCPIPHTGFFSSFCSQKTWETPGLGRLFLQETMWKCWSLKLYQSGLKNLWGLLPLRFATYLAEPSGSDDLWGHRTRGKDGTIYIYIYIYMIIYTISTTTNHNQCFLHFFNIPTHTYIYIYIFIHTYVPGSLAVTPGMVWSWNLAVYSRCCK